MRQFFFMAIIAAGMLSGCGNADYQRNEDGLLYRIIRTGKGDFLKPRTYLKIDQSAEMGDTVFFTTFGRIPTYGLYDSLPTPAHEFLDILDQMRVGDSAVVIRSVDTLVKRGFANYNSRLTKGSTIKVCIKVLAAYPDEATFEVARVKETEEFKNKEAKELEGYLKGKNIENLIKLPEGVFIKVDKEGSGIKVDSGMTVKMKYTGSLLSGKVFDSNIDTSFGHTDPFEFVVGTRQVIEGWDIGVKQLKVGTKAKIYIPSMLAYGMQGSGGKIPGYSNLVFEVEVLDAKVVSAVKPPALDAHGHGGNTDKNE